jgi:hypothetical protein
MTIYHYHHIIPKHMGGTDEPSNLIKLTVEEHAEAHRKLYEQYGYIEDEIAYKGLLKIMNKKEIIYKLLSERQMGKNNSFYGKTHNDKLKKKWSEERKGVPKSEEHKKKISLANKNRFFSEDHRKKISESNKGKKHSEEHKKKISEKLLGRIPWNKGKKRNI